MKQKREKRASERHEVIRASKEAAAEEMQGRAKAVMEEFDADKDGVLNKDEVSNLVRSLAPDGRALSDEALESLMHACTGARDGNVDAEKCGSALATVWNLVEKYAILSCAERKCARPVSADVCVLLAALPCQWGCSLCFALNM